MKYLLNTGFINEDGSIRFMVDLRKTPRKELYHVFNQIFISDEDPELFILVGSTLSNKSDAKVLYFDVPFEYRAPLDVVFNDEKVQKQKENIIKVASFDYFSNKQIDQIINRLTKQKQQEDATFVETMKNKRVNRFEYLKPQLDRIKEKYKVGDVDV